MNDVTLLKLTDALESVKLLASIAKANHNMMIYGDLQVAADVICAAIATKEAGTHEMQTV